MHAGVASFPRACNFDQKKCFFYRLSKTKICICYSKFVCRYRQLDLLYQVRIGKHTRRATSLRTIDCFTYPKCVIPLRSIAWRSSPVKRMAYHLDRHAIKSVALTRSTMLTILRTHQACWFLETSLSLGFFCNEYLATLYGVAARLRIT